MSNSSAHPSSAHDASSNSQNNAFAGFSLQEGIEFVKQLWGQSHPKDPATHAAHDTTQTPHQTAQAHADTMNLFAFPATLLDEKALQERIDQLKIVEQWLTFNLSLLRQTIQGMEVQQSTLAAIRQMSEAMNHPNYPHHQPAQPSAAAPSTAKKRSTRTKATASTSTTQSADSAAFHASPKPSPQPASPSFDPASLVQPSTWLNLAQAQFNKVAQSATVQHTVEQLADKVMQATKNTMTEAMAKTMTESIAKTVAATVDQGVAEVKKVIRKRKKTSE